jgi:hypothetical protein
MTTTTPQPADVLMHLVITLLTPMFLASTGGDLGLARAAATYTVNAYTARNPIDLLMIAQTIALGLAVLSSASLSMLENIPINLILRLRGNAASLHRAADTCRRALAEPAPEIAVPPDLHGDFDPQAEAAIIAEASRTHARAAAYQASVAQAAPARADFLDSPPTMKAAMAAIEAESQRRIAQADVALKSTGAPIPHAKPMCVPPARGPMMPASAPTIPASAPTIAASAPTIPASAPTIAASAPTIPASGPRMDDELRRAAWSSAMTDVAREMTAELATLPLAERRIAGIRVAALSSTANALISGIDPYQTS